VWEIVKFSYEILFSVISGISPIYGAFVENFDVTLAILNFQPIPSHIYCCKSCEYFVFHLRAVSGEMFADSNFLVDNFFNSSLRTYASFICRFPHRGTSWPSRKVFRMCSSITADSFVIGVVASLLHSLASGCSFSTVTGLSTGGDNSTSNWTTGWLLDI
jgi:hypothetical protein